MRCELLHDRVGVHVTEVHLPAVNIPQFDWVRTRLRGRPQPVPPIFQPEVAAGATVCAADHAPHELKVGWPTVRAGVPEPADANVAARTEARTAGRQG